MNDKRVEAIARAICIVEGCDPDTRDAVVDAHWKEYIVHAKVAIIADPVTEDVKQLVGLLFAALDVFNHDNKWNSPIEHHRWKEAAQNELKKWSGK